MKDVAVVDMHVVHTNTEWRRQKLLRPCRASLFFSHFYCHFHFWGYSTTLALLIVTASRIQMILLVHIFLSQNSLIIIRQKSPEVSGIFRGMPPSPLKKYRRHWLCYEDV